jgi:uncharacterized membrane protein (UPF0127 family)
MMLKTGSVMRPWVECAAASGALWVAGFGALACEKPAPEPAAQRAPSTTPKSEPTDTVADAPARRLPSCLVPTPKAASPAPPFAVDPKCPADPAGGSPMVPVGHVAFPESTNAPRLEVELMLTNPHQERGLMFRKSLADDKGMLFAWSTPSVHTFWMHNTCIPLDMLFIDREGYIAGIVENAPTLNDDGRSIECPVTYVLEVNAGWSRKHGVVAGQRVLLEGVTR